MKLMFLLIVIGGVYIINLDLYHVFYITALEKNFSKAANRLYITQPSVSHSIKQLEIQLDIVLFKRTSKGVITTKEGDILFEHIQHVFERVNHAERTMSAMKNLNSGTLSIGGSDSTFKHYLLPYIQSFQQLHSDIKIKIRHGSSPEIIDKLTQGIIDIGFVHLPIQNDKVQINHFINIESTFVVGEKYKHLSQCLSSLKDIQQYPLLSFSESSSSRKFLNQLFQKENIEITPDVEVGSVELLIESAKMNMGVAFINKELVQKQLEKEELFEVNIDTPIAPREIGLALNKDIPNSIVMDKFLQHISHTSISS
jgi:DNA-binding transcriptional LysR family regulator